MTSRAYGAGSPRSYYDAILVVTSFATLSWPRQPLPTRRTYVTDTLPRLIYRDYNESIVRFAHVQRSEDTVFSERELKFTFAICCPRPPVICLSSVTFVHRTQPVEIFSNVSTPFGILAIREHPRKILRVIVAGEPLRQGVKCKRGSQIFWTYR